LPSPPPPLSLVVLEKKGPKIFFPGPLAPFPLFFAFFPFPVLAPPPPVLF